MNDLFSIGEISKLFQIPVSSLRYYSDIGLITPSFIDDQSGYRYFSTEQFEMLNTIKYLQALGFSLKEIRSFLENRDVDQFVLQLEKQKLETEMKIQKLKTIEEKLENRIIQIKDALNKDKLHTIHELTLAERTVVVLNRKIKPGESLEMSIRMLENSSDMHSTIFLGKVGLAVSKENLLLNNFTEYSSIFVIVENESYNSKMQKKLQEGLYVVIRFQGTHVDSTNYYLQLLDYIRSNGYEVAGDSVEITLIDYGLTNDTSKFVTELQIPVKKSLTLK